MTEEEIAYANAVTLNPCETLREQLKTLRVKEARIAKRLKKAKEDMENVGRDDGTGRKIPAMVVLTGTQGKQADAEGVSPHPFPRPPKRRRCTTCGWTLPIRWSSNRSAGFRTASPGWKAKAARKAGTELPSSSIWAAGGDMKATVTDGIPVPVYHAEPTLARFHASDAFFRGVRGPLGSGKSVGCCAEVMSRILRQKAFMGLRRSRWAIIRNTYGELKTTTIKTWMDWYGAVTKISYGHPIMGLINMPLQDGTAVQAELVFISLDRPDHVKKLKSLELTGVWLNEASELPEEVLQMATGRVNRYPSKMQGGFSWTGIIADTNSCNVDNWWYRLAEEERPEGYDFFAQPLLFSSKRMPRESQYRENPEAENIETTRRGYGYYFLQLPGKHKEWVNVYVMNRYGSSNPETSSTRNTATGTWRAFPSIPAETSYGPTTSTSRRFPP
ncbi:MAG: hypothetical protein ACLR0N_17475 [Bilophila wadsworthia]